MREPLLWVLEPSRIGQGIVGTLGAPPTPPSSFLPSNPFPLGRSIGVTRILHGAIPDPKRNHPHPGRIFGLKGIDEKIAKDPSSRVTVNS